MPTFPPPAYTKVTDQLKGTQNCYTFTVGFTKSEPRLHYVAENSSDLSLSSLQACVLQNAPWWIQFLTDFLQASAKLFSKPYTVQQIQKIIQHTLHGTAPTVFPVTVTLLPTTIQILGGVFTVQWEYVAETVMIDLPDFADSVLPVSNEVEEVDLDAMPVHESATEVLSDPNQHYAKQKVKEARLKAKLAVYRAQQQLNQYYEKYGTEPTDSDTESESESEEEVQL